MIVRAAGPEEYTEIGNMVDKAFKPSKIERKIIQVTTCKDPNFHKGDLRITEVNGKIVSMMMLIRRPLRIGTAIVNGAIIAPVAVHPGYQGQGCCSAVMRNAVQYMKTQRFDITILWGIPWLYPRYGYSPAMLKTELVIKPEQSSSENWNSCEFRSLTRADLPKITSIYHSNTAMRTCAEIRSTKIYEWKPRGSEAKLEVLTDKKNRVIGYRALGTDWRGRLCAHEIGVLNDEACRVMLKSLAEMVRQKGLKEFYCIAHPDHPFSRFAFWRDGEIRINRGGGAGMARILNLVPLLTKMEKEFERRLYYSELHDSEHTLRISSDEELAVLEISHGRVLIHTDEVKGAYRLDIPLMYLNPLITGYKAIGELIKGPHLKVKGGKRAMRLIEVLFPSGFPFGGCPPLVWE